MFNYKCVLFGLILGSALLGDTKMAFKDLPAPVQAAAKAQTDGAQIVGASKETEKGQIIYEVETKVDGKSRDLSFDKNGQLLSVEQEVDLESLPAPAKEAIQKKAAGHTIKKVESVTQGNVVTYEATLATKGGRKSEVEVNADGTPHHD